MNRELRCGRALCQGSSVTTQMASSQSKRMLSPPLLPLATLVSLVVLYSLSTRQPLYHLVSAGRPRSWRWLLSVALAAPTDTMSFRLWRDADCIHFKTESKCIQIRCPGTFIRLLAIGFGCRTPVQAPGLPGSVSRWRAYDAKIPADLLVDSTAARRHVSAALPAPLQLDAEYMCRKLKWSTRP